MKSNQIHTAKKKWLLVLLVIAILAIDGYFRLQNRTIKEQATTKQLSQTTKPNSTSTSPTPKPVDTTSWKPYTGSGFFKYSISAPKDAYVCIGTTATGGDDYGCFPEGMYLANMKNFPYGIQFNQTYLMDINLESLADTFSYEGYEASDIDFSAQNQIMVKGRETKEFFNRKNTPITKEVFFTKYLFTVQDNNREDGKIGYFIYMPTIYTDSHYSDYPTFHTILRSWKNK